MVFEMDSDIFAKHLRNASIYAVRRRPVFADPWTANAARRIIQPSKPANKVQ